MAIHTLITRLETFPARARLASLIVGAALAGCGGGDSPTPAPTPTPTPTPTATGPKVSGVVAANKVVGATVTAYVLNADGTNGASLGSATTAADGSYTLTLSSTPTGPIVVIATGGTYTAESDGTTTTFSSLRSLVPAVPAGGSTGVVITPLSDMIASRSLTLVGSGSTLDAALSAASALVKTAYGFSGAVSGISPAFDKASIGTDPYLLGLVLGAFDTCAKSASSASRGDLYAALSADFSDGVFDGKSAGKPVSLGSGKLSSTAGTSDFLNCIATYAGSGKAVTDAGVTGADLATSLITIRTAVTTSPSTPISTGLAAGSSGAISTLAYGGKQWVFIAARSSGVVAIDVTDPTVATPTVRSYPGLTANFGGNGIGGVLPMLGADHPQLLVYAYGSKHIALVNADTGAVDYEADLPLAATSPVSFSGGSAYISGAIPDTGRDGAWLSTADGYVFFSRATRTLGTLYGIDAPARLAENVGGDVDHGILFAANYEPGVQLIDLVDSRSYYLDGTAFNSAFSNTSVGSLNEPDAASVDSGYRVGIITDEDTGTVGLINLKTIVKTPVTGGKSTFAPGAGGSILTVLQGPILSGSAVDSDSHLALFMAGYSSDVAVASIQDPAAVAAGSTWQGINDWRYISGMTGYEYAQDPHAAAAVKNLGNGKSYGYLLDGSNHKAFQVDLSAFLAGTAAGTTGSDAHRLAVDPTTNGTVKSITW